MCPLLHVKTNLLIVSNTLDYWNYTYIQCIIHINFTIYVPDSEDSKFEFIIVPVHMQLLITQTTKS